MSKFTDDMDAALRIRNPWEIGKRYECPVIYYMTQHPHAFGHNDYRAEIVFARDGKRYKKEFRVREGVTQKNRRELHLQTAQAWAEAQLGTTEWVPTGFPNTWMPKDAHERMKGDLKAWRKEQREASK
ncbi:hypothetical protein ACWGQT_07285 [Streptomyces yangpuensis]